MIKVLFLCHGNICRSPMAEFVLKDMVQKLGLTNQFKIASAATSTEEIGNPVHPGTKKKLAEHGISCAGKTAIQVKKQDYDNYDYLIAMDYYNIKNMARFFGSNKEKIYLLLEFVGSSDSIADPWYTQDFEETYRDVVRGCKGFLKHLSETKQIYLLEQDIDALG